MTIRKLILTGLLALATAGVSHAGPLGLFGRNKCGGCGGGQQVVTVAAPPVVYQTAPQYTPVAAPQPTVVTMPQVGTVGQGGIVYQTSYTGIGVLVDATEYTPIRMGGGLVPTTCGPTGCPK